MGGSIGGIGGMGVRGSKGGMGGMGGMDCRGNMYGIVGFVVATFSVLVAGGIVVANDGVEI